MQYALKYCVPRNLNVSIHNLTNIHLFRLLANQNISGMQPLWTELLLEN